MFTVHRPPHGPVDVAGLQVHFPDGALDLQLRSGRLVCQSPDTGDEPAVLRTIALRNGGANDLRLGIALFVQGRRAVPGEGELRLQAEGLDSRPQPWGAVQVGARLGAVPIQVLADHERAELVLFIRRHPADGHGPDEGRFVVHPCGANCFSVGVQ